ncbi:carboxypeptidase-like regulatory domain-containing protein [Parabacteroides distasonis]|nr:carboxypeptidase-like regulatory domain-containing protein [Parabacteroides distasonis]
MEKGTANGTVTDMDGKYTLEVSSSTVVLQLSYIGYLTKGKATHLPFIKDGQEVHLALFLKQKPEHQETIRYFLPEDIIETI